MNGFSAETVMEWLAILSVAFFILSKYDTDRFKTFANSSRDTNKYRPTWIDDMLPINIEEFWSTTLTIPEFAPETLMYRNKITEKRMIYLFKNSPKLSMFKTLNVSFVLIE